MRLFQPSEHQSILQRRAHSCPSASGAFSLSLSLALAPPPGTGRGYESLQMIYPTTRGGGRPEGRGGVEGGGGGLGPGGCCSLKSTLNAMRSGSSRRPLRNKRALRSVPSPANNQHRVPSRRRLSGWVLPNVQIFTAPERVKLMEPRTQEISGEMNCATKAGSICTDKSMKNGAAKCSACTAEQVNCPFCLLWESNFSQMQPYVFGS